MPTLRRLLLVLFVLISCIGCDQSTKSLAESHLPHAQPISMAADVLRLQVIHNEGAFLSLGATSSDAWRLVVLRIGVGLLLLALFAYAVFVRRRQALFVLGLTLLLAGGTSNLLDRVVHAGYVVDFVNIGIGSLRTGIFNFADVFIVCGVLLLFVPGDRGRPGSA